MSWEQIANVVKLTSGWCVLCAVLDLWQCRVAPAGAHSAGVKWPSDILVGDKKLAGILTDCSIMGPSVLALVGVGVRPVGGDHLDS